MVVFISTETPKSGTFLQRYKRKVNQNSRNKPKMSTKRLIQFPIAATAAKQKTAPNTLATKKDRVRVCTCESERDGEREKEMLNYFKLVIIKSLIHMDHYCNREMQESTVITKRFAAPTTS